MKTIRYLLDGATAYKALKLAALAALAIFTSNVFGVPPWILFVGWVGHDVFCETPKNIGPTYIQGVVGIFLAITISLTGGFLSNYISPLGGPLAVFLVVFFLFFVKKAKYLNNIIAYFLGMIAWFGYNESSEFDSILTVILTFGAGFLFAHINARFKILKLLKK